MTKNKLSGLRCVACRGGDPQATPEEIVEYHASVPDWQIVGVDGINRLQRQFKLKNFVEALEFANQIGSVAEEQDHHPLMVVEWGKVEIQWWTHVVKGLHKNDFIMASKTDEIFNQQDG